MTKVPDNPEQVVDAALPTKDLVLFDGRCQFCRRQVDRIASYDRRDRMTFISLHDPRVRHWFPDLEHDELMQHMYLIDRAGHRYVGAEAFRYLTRQLPRLWPLAPLLHIPGSLAFWQWLYHQLARRRYAIGGASCESETCDAHFDK
jgi:predicted DCC family thiol-disulfide oxidoreductase YuxK